MTAPTANAKHTNTNTPASMATITGEIAQQNTNSIIRAINTAAPMTVYFNIILIIQQRYNKNPTYANLFAKIYYDHA